MNQLLSYFIFFMFFIFTNGNNLIFKAHKPCQEINDFKDPSYKLEFDDYAVNIEFCSRNNADDSKCCYINFSNTTGKYYGCGKINSNDIKEEVIKTKIEEINSGNNQLNITKIDCFSKKLDFMKTILMISLIYLI